MNSRIYHTCRQFTCISVYSSMFAKASRNICFVPWWISVFLLYFMGHIPETRTLWQAITFDPDNQFRSPCLKLLWLPKKEINRIKVFPTCTVCFWNQNHCEQPIISSKVLFKIELFYFLDTLILLTCLLIIKITYFRGDPSDISAKWQHWSPPCRVVPHHSLKLLAQLQSTLVKEALPSAQRNPLLARIEVRAGHGAGKPTAKVVQEVADMWAFAAAATGATFQPQVE